MSVELFNLARMRAKVKKIVGPVSCENTSEQPIFVVLGTPFYYCIIIMRGILGVLLVEFDPRLPIVGTPPGICRVPKNIPLPPCGR